jgi:hypothetical protein
VYRTIGTIAIESRRFSALEDEAGHLDGGVERDMLDDFELAYI